MDADQDETEFTYEDVSDYTHTLSHTYTHTHTHTHTQANTYTPEDEDELPQDLVDNPLWGAGVIENTSRVCVCMCVWVVLCVWVLCVCVGIYLCMYMLNQHTAHQMQPPRPPNTHTHTS